jgi:TPP-dependent trihydroxycyclohexane-1,2-dione (THcHDO) dehydratase
VKTVRLTAAQALVAFLANQFVERDGVEHRFFGGCFGIFGHGNVGGIGEALFERPDLLTYYQSRNEQAMVHTAVGYARMRNRLGALACTSSIGPGRRTSSRARQSPPSTGCRSCSCRPTSSPRGGRTRCSSNSRCPGRATFR